MKLISLARHGGIDRWEGKSEEEQGEGEKKGKKGKGREGE